MTLTIWSLIALGYSKFKIQITPTKCIDLNLKHSIDMKEKAAIINQV